MGGAVQWDVPVESPPPFPNPYFFAASQVWAGLDTLIISFWVFTFSRLKLTIFFLSNLIFCFSRHLRSRSRKAWGRTIRTNLWCVRKYTIFNSILTIETESNGIGSCWNCFAEMEVWNGCEHQEICNFARMPVIWENWVISRACRAYRLSSIRPSSVFRKSMLLEYFENVSGRTGEGVISSLFHCSGSSAHFSRIPHAWTCYHGHCWDG